MSRTYSRSFRMFEHVRAQAVLAAVVGPEVVGREVDAEEVRHAFLTVHVVTTRNVLWMLRDVFCHGSILPREAALSGGLSFPAAEPNGVNVSHRPGTPERCPISWVRVWVRYPYPF